jgi:hypothetical protein
MQPMWLFDNRQGAQIKLLLLKECRIFKYFYEIPFIYNIYRRKIVANGIVEITVNIYLPFLNRRSVVL